MRVGDLVEHQDDSLLGKIADIGRLERLGLRQQALMHGVRTQPVVDHARVDDFRGDAELDLVVGQPLGGVFRQPQLANPALRIGQCRRHRVPAIQNDRPVRAGLAVTPAAPAAAKWASFVGSFAASALKARFSITIAHRRLVSRVPDNGNLDPRRPGIKGGALVDFAGPFPP